MISQGEDDPRFHAKKSVKKFKNIQKANVIILGYHAAKCFFSVVPWKLEGSVKLLKASFKSFFLSVLFDGEKTSGRRLCTAPPPPSSETKSFFEGSFWLGGGGGGGTDFAAAVSVWLQRGEIFLSAVECDLQPRSLFSNSSPSWRTLTLISPFWLLKTHFSTFFNPQSRSWRRPASLWIPTSTPPPPPPCFTRPWSGEERKND